MKTILHIDDTITKEVMANVNATSFGEQFTRMPASCSTSNVYEKWEETSEYRNENGKDDLLRQS